MFALSRIATKRSVRLMSGSSREKIVQGLYSLNEISTCQTEAELDAFLKNSKLDSTHAQDQVQLYMNHKKQATGFTFSKDNWSNASPTDFFAHFAQNDEPLIGMLFGTFVMWGIAHYVSSSLTEEQKLKSYSYRTYVGDLPFEGH